MVCFFLAFFAIYPFLLLEDSQIIKPISYDKWGSNSRPLLILDQVHHINKNSN